MWIYSPVSQIDDTVRTPRKKQERPSRTREYQLTLEHFWQTSKLIICLFFCILFQKCQTTPRKNKRKNISKFWENSSPCQQTKHVLIVVKEVPLTSTPLLVHLCVYHAQESCKSATWNKFKPVSLKCHHFIDSRRGLTPPHRVKSISMASFTPEEIDFLKSRGNEVIEMFNFLIEEVLDWFNCLASAVL